MSYVSKEDCKKETPVYKPGHVDPPTDFPPKIVPPPSQVGVDTVKIDLTGLQDLLHDSRKHEPPFTQQMANRQQDIERKNYALKVRDATHRIKNGPRPNGASTPGLENKF